MKRDIRRRLARLEAKLLQSAAYTDLVSRDYQSAEMAIVAFYAGKLAPGESIETGLNRALNIPADESVKPDYEGPELWPLVLEKLDSIVACRVGRPLIHEGPGADDDQRRRYYVLDDLYEEMPEERKNPNRIPRYFADFLL
jgi:hypothetical protein